MSGGSMEPASKVGRCTVLDTITKEGLQWLSAENVRQHLKVNFCMVAAVLDDPEFPLCVQAALALTEMSRQHVAASQEGHPGSAQDVGDLDILNRSMEVMVGGVPDRAPPRRGAADCQAGDPELGKVNWGCDSRRDDNKDGVVKTTDDHLHYRGHNPYYVHAQDKIFEILPSIDNFVSYRCKIVKMRTTSTCCSMSTKRASRLSGDAPLPPFPPGFRPLDGSAQSIQLSVSVHVLGQTSGPDPSHDPLAHRMILGSSSSAPPIGSPPDMSATVGRHPPMPDKHADQIASKREQSERINMRRWQTVNETRRHSVALKEDVIESRGGKCEDSRDYAQEKPTGSIGKSNGVCMGMPSKPFIEGHDVRAQMGPDGRPRVESMGGDLGRIKMWVRRVKEVPTQNGEQESQQRPSNESNEDLQLRRKQRTLTCLRNHFPTPRAFDPTDFTTSALLWRSAMDLVKFKQISAANEIEVPAALKGRKSSQQ
ncbi:hypothetical protein B0H14DRAFT_2652404 [Mycena olivaceomarginata]|nr:hypothetical protein B0H14DRAFT_2652404 [Mycena olivaceomarginata]